MLVLGTAGVVQQHAGDAALAEQQADRQQVGPGVALEIMEGTRGVGIQLTKHRFEQNIGRF